MPFCKHLLITGGHGDEDEIHNRLYTQNGQQYTWTCQRLPSYHGSGCTLASALAGRLPGAGVRSALDYTWRTLRDAEQLGKASTCRAACPWTSALETRLSMKLRGLYAITDSQLLANRFLSYVEAALEGGVCLLQYRDKATTQRAGCVKPKR